MGKSIKLFGESTKLFLGGILKRFYYWIPPIFLDLFDLYNRYIKKLLPANYQQDINMPYSLGLLIFILMILWAGLMTFHELHKISEKEIKNIKAETIEEYLSLNPDARIDKAHRIFCKLYKEGQMNISGKVGEDRWQTWDENIRKAMLEHCNKECINIYLMNTGRIHEGITPLKENYYNAALRHINNMLENDFQRNIKL